MKKKNDKIAGDILIFSEKESNVISREVLRLRDQWIRRGPEISSLFHVFFSLGAASSTDAALSLSEYVSRASETNVLLESKFQWVYERIEEKLSSKIGPCKIERALAYPGFHIFHIPLFLKLVPDLILEKMVGGNVDTITPVVHYDLQHRYLSKHWRNYKSFDFDKTLSFTIPVMMPTAGTGINLFKLDRIRSHENPSAFFKNGGEDILTRGSKNSICFNSLQRLDVLEDWEKFSIEYRSGVCFYHTGKILHQANITRENMRPGEHRITIQGHGVLCDGVWRLYF